MSCVTRSRSCFYWNTMHIVQLLSCCYHDRFCWFLGEWVKYRCTVHRTQSTSLTIYVIFLFSQNLHWPHKLSAIDPDCPSSHKQACMKLIFVNYKTQFATSLRSVPAWHWWYIGPIVVGNVGDTGVSSYRLLASETPHPSVICVELLWGSRHPVTGRLAIHSNNTTVKFRFACADGKGFEQVRLCTRSDGKYHWHR